MSKSNITAGIRDKHNRDLHNKRGHPLCILKEIIQDYFGVQYETFDDFNPVVTVKQNFDDVLVPADHPSRSPNDTYYLDDGRVLRTQTTAHQVPLLKKGHRKFLVTGDVYRRDSIDRYHFPVFHQMEGVRVVPASADFHRFTKVDLQGQLNGLVNRLFPGCEYRWVDTTFPFTDPSWEIEVKLGDDWVEVLGCGIMHHDVLRNAGLSPEKNAGWAFGLGLERLAMILFGIPDIRLFWTDDPRFLKQFESGKVVKFQPYSSFPPTTRDVAFWHDAPVADNDVYEILRELGGDEVEEVALIDAFTHPKTGRQSRCYRIVYRSNDRTLTNEEINRVQEGVREALVNRLHVELR